MLQLATRLGLTHAQGGESLGPELVGDPWSNPRGWGQAGNIFSLSSVASGTETARTGVVTVGRVYKYTLTILSLTPGVIVQLRNDVTFIDSAGSGSVSGTFTANNTQMRLRSDGATATGSIKLSIREVL